MDIVKQALDIALQGSSPDLPAQSQSARALTSINPALPALSTKLLQRIWVGEYIDFAELPPAKSKPRSLPHYLQGQVIVVQMQELESNSKKAITDFSTWAQCFALYSAAVLIKQPSRATDLMAYFYTMANNARKYKWPSWLMYDQNFWSLMADTGSTVWAKISPEIFCQCFNSAQKVSQEAWCRNSYSVDHTSGQCPYIPPPTRGRQDTTLPAESARSRDTICKDFNNNKDKGCRWGTNCFRRHICSICRGPHPKSRCRSKPEGTPSPAGGE